MEIVEDFEQLARYAGSLDNGAVDTEYTHLHLPHSIVAPPLGDVVAAQGNRILALERNMFDQDEENLLAYSHRKELEERIAHLERMLHKAANCSRCTDDYGDEVGASELAKMQSAMIDHYRNEATAALAELAAERAELEALRALKASVPWEAIHYLVTECPIIGNGNYASYHAAIRSLKAFLGEPPHA